MAIPAEPVTSDRSPRDAAVQQVPRALREEVRLVGDALGEVIAEHGGAALLADVEALRRTVIRARAQDERRGGYSDADTLVSSWSLDRAEQVARAFTCYFHLVNLAEERYRAGALRDSGAAGPAEALTNALATVRAELGNEGLDALLANMRVHPVFTAHPTEARRRAVTSALRRVGDQLERLSEVRSSDAPPPETRRRLLEEVDGLWRTAQLRSQELQPLDEVRALMGVFDETLFRLVPAVYRELSAALDAADTGTRLPPAPAFLRFGSWVGGDRDGNPHITAQVTRETMLIQSEHILRGLEAACARIGTGLTADSATTPPDARFLSRLRVARGIAGGRAAAIGTRSPGEPYREFLLLVAERIGATRRADLSLAYAGPDELVDDLLGVQDALATAGAPRQAYGELHELIWQAQTFGFHLADLEIRQHSSVHRNALAEIDAGGARSPETEEVVATLRTVALLQQRLGTRVCHRYVVSFTRSADDIEAVYALADRACAPGAAPELDVIPLFETIADLRNSRETLDTMLTLEPVRRRMAATGRGLEVMLGYSDSAKESGPVTATLALYTAQADLAAWAAEQSVQLTLFHGRGGALGRGGGPANRAVMAQAPGSVSGRFKVTEQGEVIFARYGNRTLAQRHLEQVTSAVLLTSTTAARRHNEGAANRFAALARTLDDGAGTAYRELIESNGFAEYFAEVTPVRELARLNLGSRPASRGGDRSLASLRAIPWVFAWSQIRLNLPGWYGIGSGLAGASLDELRIAYEQWPLLNVLIDNAEMSLAKTDRFMATEYLRLGRQPRIAELILAEYDRTIERILAVTGQSRLLEKRRVLSWAVELRNPYIDALCHLQLRALRALRSGDALDADRRRLEQLLLLTVNGIAAGLQNTG
ncbi:MAG TPA: phosphoenolpyruvate carboxylase [Candidatus Dormibacteraeota bacterium]|nr:phosphoenolpyruvate carboxylase [Candidatus Dormibacteraeota bacterium]